MDYGYGSGSDDSYNGSTGPSENAVMEFWQELEMILNRSCDTLDATDEVLKAIYRCCNKYDDCIQCDEEWETVGYKILDSRLYQRHPTHIRNKMIAGIRKACSYRPFFGPYGDLILAKGTSTAGLNVMATVLMLLGCSEPDHTTFHLMLENDCFERLKGEILDRKDDEEQWLVKRLMKLLYEMSRIQKLRREDLQSIDDEFITYLLDLVEAAPTDASDPYNYIIIRVLLIINEQYMLLTHKAKGDDVVEEEPLTNRVLKTLCFKGGDYRSFGESIILLLNRETETALQLLILKVLYLLFTTKATQEFFYDNDLRVLVDVIIRNVLDLPDEAYALRHTYLRVLYPLLSYSQLRYEPYKVNQLTHMFNLLTTSRSTHFAPADETTVRLVTRCQEVKWLQPPESPTSTAPGTPALTRESTVESSIGPATDDGNDDIDKPAGEDTTKADNGESSLEPAPVITETSKPKPKSRRRHPPPPIPRGANHSHASHAIRSGPPSPTPSSHTPLTRTSSSASSTPSSPTNHHNLPLPAARKLGISLAHGLDSQRSVLELAQTSSEPGIDAPSRTGRRSQPPVPHTRRGQPIKATITAITSRRPPPPPIPTTTNQRSLLPPIPPTPSNGARTPSRPQTPTSPLSDTMARMAIDEPDHTKKDEPEHTAKETTEPDHPLKKDPAISITDDLAPSPQLSSTSVESALGISTIKAPPVSIRGKMRRPPPPPPRKGRKGVAGAH
ncbi:hypothetical protein BJ508DRAFT_326578 [Ascobolus immersus RN42]|uniref:SPIN90/Ldb17 leucine-rich domain-containing protein n=1 Tax=Ascobolus immersus RN42 TaxID=1160509 RepID=A0A3N4IAH4_ASCIM|nr:hypothetical protein BJ508DRAFT_326578 [Ascobolus immersus RN42]